MNTIVDCRLFGRFKSLTVDFLALDIRRTCHPRMSEMSTIGICDADEPNSFCQLIAEYRVITIGF